MRQQVELSPASAVVSPLCPDTNASTSTRSRRGSLRSRLRLQTLLSLAGVVLPDASGAAAMQNHVQINEGDVTRRFLESLDLIDHIQFANPPGRNELGVGELDFDHIFHLIDSSATRSG
jgi:hypothetical protein